MNTKLLNKEMSNLQYIGNKDILQNKKVSFLCSRKCPSGIILKSYDWAVEQKEKGSCIISGFHSKIEKDVLRILLNGYQPIILALARGLKNNLEPEFKMAIDDSRLLILTPFEKEVQRVTGKTAIDRNRTMSELAEEIFIAHASPEGNLYRLVTEILLTDKKIHTFNVKENRHLIEMGFGYI